MKEQTNKTQIAKAKCVKTMKVQTIKTQIAKAKCVEFGGCRIGYNYTTKLWFIDDNIHGWTRTEKTLWILCEKHLISKFSMFQVMKIYDVLAKEIIEA